MKPTQVKQHVRTNVCSPQMGQCRIAASAACAKVPTPGIQAKLALQEKTRVLQTKLANRQQSPAIQTFSRPVAPPVYRPERRTIVQPKVMLQPRKPPTAPPVYRPTQKQMVQPKMTPAHLTPKAPPVYRPQPPPKVLQTKTSRTAIATLNTHPIAVRKWSPSPGKNTPSPLQLAQRVPGQGHGNIKPPVRALKPNVLQAVWVDDPKQDYYFWTPPVEGVQWFAHKRDPEQMYFEVLGPKSGEKYGSLAGRENAQRRDRWVRLHGSDPMRRAENPAPIPVDQLRREIEADLRQFEIYQKKGVERYGRLERAPRALDPRAAEDRDAFYRLRYHHGHLGARHYEPGDSVDYMSVFLQQRKSKFEERDMTNEEQFRDPPDKGQYKNQFDLASGTIVADQNYSAAEMYDDRSTGKRETYNNSELLFQQWRQAKRIMGPSAKAKLEVLRRAHVAGDGIPVVKAVRTWLEHQEREYDARTDFTFPKGHPCFFALLAAANCAAAIFLIADHGIEMGITEIAKIVLKAGNSIEIVFA